MTTSDQAQAGTSATARVLFHTTHEAAAMLRLAPRTLERFRLEGSGPRFRKFGRKVLYAPADLTAWADARAHLSTSEAA